MVHAQQSSVSGSLARSLNDAFTQVYDKVAPAVVVVDARYPATAGLQGLPGLLLRNPNGGSLPELSDEGSGVIISADGYILTNNHVVESAGEGRIIVNLKDGRKFPAELVGQDPSSDLAVLKIKATGLPVAELADSDHVKVGQFAFAIGAPFDLPYTFTIGVVSAKGRTNLLQGNTGYEEYIQTDASINPGNSGGPLCDIEGRVVGINTMISGVNRGLGFAIPINIARQAAQQLIQKGYVSRPWLGIEIKGLSENERLQAAFPDLKSGVLVGYIVPDAPAYSSDLHTGDVILKVDGVPVDRSTDLQREILKKPIGQAVKLDIYRGGRAITVSIATAEKPNDMIPAANRRSPGDDGQRPVPRRNQRPRTPQENVPPGRDDGQGVTLQNAENESGPAGVRVTEVAPGSAADNAGIQAGDVITEVAGRPIHSVQDYQTTLKAADVSRGVIYALDRDGDRTFVILKP